MALPTIVGSPVSGTGNLSLPTGWAAGDIFLIGYMSRGTQGAVPTGYTQVPGCNTTDGGANQVRLRVWWRRAQAGDGTIVVNDQGDMQWGGVMAFRGCEDDGSPWNLVVTGTEGSDASLSATGGTTTVDDCLVYVATSRQIDQSGAQYSAGANADLANFAERLDGGTSVGLGGGVAIFTGEKATAGAFGASTATIANNTNKNFATIALMPPQPGHRRGQALSAGQAVGSAAAWMRSAAGLFLPDRRVWVPGL